jgi:hypothetical protein
MRAPLLFTIEETVQALRIAHAAREYVLRSEEMARLLVEGEKPLDPKIELRTGEAWSRLLEAVKAPTGPPEKKEAAGEKAARLNSLNSANSITFRAAAQARKSLARLTSLSNETAQKKRPRFETRPPSR